MALRERGLSSLSGNKELTCRVAWPENYIKKMGTETSLVVQWIRSHLSMQAGDTGLISGQGRFHRP